MSTKKSKMAVKSHFYHTLKKWNQFLMVSNLEATLSFLILIGEIKGFLVKDLREIRKRHLWSGKLAL
jgi:hypothetical protein